MRPSPDAPACHVVLEIALQAGFSTSGTEAFAGLLVTAHELNRHTDSCTEADEIAVE